MSDNQAGVCERCARAGGHDPLETDCILNHNGHQDRHVGLLCKRHYHWISDTLGQIQELFTLLDEVLLPGATSGGDRHGTRDGSPAPGRVEVMALTHRGTSQEWIGDDEAIPDVLGALDTWVSIIEDEVQDAVLRPERHVTFGPCCPLLPDPTLSLTHKARMTCAHDSCAATRPLDPPTLTELVRFLTRWRHYAASQAWVEDFIDDLAALHRHVARGLGDSMWPKPIGKCPNDSAPLYNTIGVDEVTCRRCRTSWSGVHLTRLRLIHEQEAS